MGFVSYDRSTQMVVKPAIDPAAARASSTNGTPVDTNAATGGDRTKTVTFVVAWGVITDGTYTLSIEESDTSGGTYTAVPAARLFNSVGTVPATADSTANVLSAKLNKRWCRLVVTAAGTTTGAIYSAVAILETF